MNFALDDKTLAFVEKSTGMRRNQLSRISLRDVEKARNSESYYLVKKPREKVARGSVYLLLNRILSLVKVDRYLSHI